MAELYNSDDESDGDFVEAEDPVMSDKGNDSDDGTDGTDKKRALDEVSVSEEEGAAPKKKSRDTGGSSLVDDEAEEGDDDEGSADGGNSDDDDDDEGDEEKDTYVADGFVVLDDDENSSDNDTVRVKKKRNFERLRVGKSLVGVEDDDLELIRDNLAREKGRDEIAPELVRDEDVENDDEGGTTERQRGGEERGENDSVGRHHRGGIVLVMETIMIVMT